MGLPAYADDPALLVLCACPDETVALRIARALVQEHLAACVNRLPAGTSIYEWEGRLCEEPEQLLLIKTTAVRYPALETRLKTLHPYEIPEIIAIPVVTGSSQYLTWLATATDPDSEAFTSSSVHPT